MANLKKAATSMPYQVFEFQEAWHMEFSCI